MIFSYPSIVLSVAFLSVHIHQAFASISPRSIHGRQNFNSTLLPSTTSPVSSPNITQSLLTTSTSYILNSGSQILNIVGDSGNGLTTDVVTITGPTTLQTTITCAPAETEVCGIAAGFNTSDPHCYQTTKGVYSRPEHIVTYAQLFTILTAHQTITTELFVGVQDFQIGGESSQSNFTFTGPSTVSTTVTSLLEPDLDTSDGGQHWAGLQPGAVCGGKCGWCQLFFPTVYVYYWPVAGQNTACLNSTSTSAQFSVSSGGVVVSARQMPQALAGASTLVNSNGFTFTSPSAYIALPTISAFDECGLLGDVHTSTTLAFAPGQLSTLVGGFDQSTAFPFNFADADCPPSTLNMSQMISIVGQQGYNPVISPPAELTTIDPLWNANCFVAPFQGNDPPIALLPVANIFNPTTSADPMVATAPASPSTGVPALPDETNLPGSSVTAWSPQTAAIPDGGPVSSVTPDNPVPASQGTPAGKDPNTSIPQNTPSGQGSADRSDNPVPQSTIPWIQEPTNPLPSALATSLLNEGSSNIMASSTPAAPEVLTSAGSTAIVAQSTPVTPWVQKPTNPLPSALVASLLNEGSSTIVAESSPTAPAVLISAGSTAIVAQSTPVTPWVQKPTNPLPSALVASLLNEGSSSNVAGSTPVAPAVLTVAGQTITADSASIFVIASQTLSPGSAITVSGTPISFPASASYLIEGTSTIPFTSSTPAPGPEFLTFAGQVLTANSASGFVIAGQTLAPGSAITVSGTPISLAATPTDVVIGTSTQGLGGVIMSGFVGPSPSGPATFKGGAERQRESLAWGIGGVVLAGVLGWL